MPTACFYCKHKKIQSHFISLDKALISSFDFIRKLQFLDILSKKGEKVSWTLSYNMNTADKLPAPHNLVRRDFIPTAKTGQEKNEGKFGKFFSSGRLRVIASLAALGLLCSVDASDAKADGVIIENQSLQAVNARRIAAKDTVVEQIEVDLLGLSKDMRQLCEGYYLELKNDDGVFSLSDTAEYDSLCALPKLK